MTEPRPPQVLPEEVVCSSTHGEYTLVVAGPPSALGEESSGVGDAIVGDGGCCSTFFRGFVETDLDVCPESSDLRFKHEVWGPRDGWLSFTTEQTFLGGPDDPEDVMATVRTLSTRLRALEAAQR